MEHRLQEDLEQLPDLLERTLAVAREYLEGLAERSPDRLFSAPEGRLPEAGLGAEGVLDLFVRTYAGHLIGSAGPRYFGYVTGGTTPAALMGDWLVSAYDQLAASDVIIQVERETLHMLRELLRLPEAFHGTFTSGATVSEFIGLATARQWVAARRGVDPARDGLYGLGPIRVFGASPHSSIYKALAMLGMGSRSLTEVPALPGREAMDPSALERELARLDSEPVIVVATAGTVNSGDFDDFSALAALKERYGFWLHVDAAFGGYAASSPAYEHLTEDWEAADSIAIDAHKWLNVPYDAGMHFSRHPKLQAQVFRQVNAAYIGEEVVGDEVFPNLTPQLSRRWRGLPAWFTLLAYGRDGHREIVERNCRQAAWLGACIATSDSWELLAPVTLNVVCFAPRQSMTLEQVNALLQRLNDEHGVFMTSTVFQGRPAIRAALCNWRTTDEDLRRTWEGLEQVLTTAGDPVARPASAR